VTLAIDTYRGIASLVDGAGLLNLALTLDEREFLAIDIDAVVSRCLASEVESGPKITREYLVQDPYGARALGPALESFFAIDGLAADVSCAAGVNALLHALPGAWPVRSVLLPRGIYPDFPHWLERAGVHLVPMAPMAEAAPWRDGLRAGAGLVFLERPSFAAAGCTPLEQVRELCRDAADHGAAVLIDESNANYCAPSESAVALTRELDNLTVLRGLSKAYGLGGLRLGWCVSSPALTQRIRAALPPLQAASLSLRIGRMVLEAGDVAAPLRARIPTAKRAAAALFVRAGIELLPCSAALPYVLPAGASLQERGIAVITKKQPLWAGEREPALVQRCSVPLRDDRMNVLRNRLFEANPGASSKLQRGMT
jgi:histidinol-phosphate/aromatic aminotransferase/cobyric acid decarboxylase-like protein